MATGFDTYLAEDAGRQAQAIKSKGYTFVGMYYFASSQVKQHLTKAVALALSAAGLYVVSVYESGFPTNSRYFSAAQGGADGAMAMQRAAAAGQPKGTPIYAAVDYDAVQRDILAITAYFKSYHATLTEHGYLPGVYGNGIVCSAMVKAGLAEKTWLSGSTMWGGYSHWLKFADIVQGRTTLLFGMDCDLDTTAPSGGGGWQVADHNKAS